MLIVFRLILEKAVKFLIHHLVVLDHRWKLSRLISLLVVASGVTTALQLLVEQILAVLQLMHRNQTRSVGLEDGAGKF